MNGAFWQQKRGYDTRLELTWQDAVQEVFDQWARWNMEMIEDSVSDEVQ